MAWETSPPGPFDYPMIHRLERVGFMFARRVDGSPPALQGILAKEATPGWALVWGLSCVRSIPRRGNSLVPTIETIGQLLYLLCFSYLTCLRGRGDGDAIRIGARASAGSNSPWQRRG